MIAPILWSTIGISAFAALVLICTVVFQSFNGKIHYALAFLAMIWTLLMVGFEASSPGFDCQIHFATLAWVGHGLVPVAWYFFVLAYVDNNTHGRKAGLALAILPTAVFVFAATNAWHHLLYTDATAIPTGQTYIDYVHGPGFYAIVGLFYAFAAAAIFCLIRAFVRAERSAWPLLAALVLVTSMPVIGNLAYIGLGFTVYGADPTPFMFTLGLLPFTWMLMTNRTMDMASVGRSVLFNTMSEPVVMVDKHHEIVLMNAAAKASAREHGFRRFRDALRTSVDRLDTPKAYSHLSLGERIYEPRVREVGNPLDPVGRLLGWSITLVDITDRIAITFQLEDALKKADAASRAKDEFVSVVSHELRTPLTSLRGGLTLALSGHLGELTKPIRSSLEIANRNGIRLSRLVDNILLTQKIDLEALSLDTATVDLGKLLEDSFDENRMYAAGRGVRLVMPNRETSAIVTGDDFAIRQIIDNLISNAIKFSNEHGIVEGALTVVDGRVRLSIRDTGSGIPDGMEDKVFGRFEQLENGGQAFGQGSGLGLHISKRLAERLSGKLFYESRVGFGTTFHLEFAQAGQLGEQPLVPSYCA
ncbi:ATPase [Salipiger sp. IMCC34102]|uniref:sensor histidine kinase n=1 Tax=Salipiger sp. IMCC34102 TaxID=2510647 RepID=UPI00101BB5F3|nr:histidine kinase N-terminal 7TM domain-containing protein [Salipiger sp. IMCC34102]RYH01172.1 ATPase [Salipiger sp. IMCC34102]